MNSGCYENDISKVLISVNAIDKNNLSEVEIKNSTVQAFKDEKSLLLSFVKFIQTLDPDILTGYNIFGFDFAYMMVAFY